MGAEIALTLASKMPEAGISVDQYLFDGGPFFHFSGWFRAIMRMKFKSMVHQAQHGSYEEITERFSKNKMVQWMIHGDISPYKWFIKGLADSAPFMSDASIGKESDACYTFDYPEASSEEQKKYKRKKLFVPNGMSTYRFVFSNTERQNHIFIIFLAN